MLHCIFKKWGAHSKLHVCTSIITMYHIPQICMEFTKLHIWRQWCTDPCNRTDDPIGILKTTGDILPQPGTSAPPVVGSNHRKYNCYGNVAKIAIDIIILLRFLAIICLLGGKLAGYTLNYCILHQIWWSSWIMCEHWQFLWSGALLIIPSRGSLVVYFDLDHMTL